MGCELAGFTQSAFPAKKDRASDEKIWDLAADFEIQRVTDAKIRG